MALPRGGVVRGVISIATDVGVGSRASGGQLAVTSGRLDIAPYLLAGSRAPFDDIRPYPYESGWTT